MFASLTILDEQSMQWYTCALSETAQHPTASSAAIIMAKWQQLAHPHHTHDLHAPPLSYSSVLELDPS